MIKELLNAIRDRDTKEALRILRIVENSNPKNIFSLSPQESQEAFANLGWSQGFNIQERCKIENAGGVYEATLLILAVINDLPEVVAKLLGLGALPHEEIDSNGFTALHHAAAGKNLDTLNILLGYLQNKLLFNFEKILTCLQVRTNDGRDCFALVSHEPVQQHLEKIRRLVQEAFPGITKVLLNFIREDNPATLDLLDLISIARTNLAKSVESKEFAAGVAKLNSQSKVKFPSKMQDFYVNLDAPVSVPVPQEDKATEQKPEKTTFLIFAVRHRRKGVVKKLLKSIDKRILFKDTDGHNAVHHAILIANKTKTASVTYLKDSDINTDEYQIFFDICMNDLGIANELNQETDNQKRNSLHLVAAEGLKMHAKVVLASYPFGLSEQDKYGDTPLHVAANSLLRAEIDSSFSMRCYKVIEEFVGAMVDPKALMRISKAQREASLHRLVLAFAKHKKLNFKNILQIIKNLGIPEGCLNLLNKDEKTAFDLAKEMGFAKEICDLLDPAAKLQSAADHLSQLMQQTQVGGAMTARVETKGEKAGKVKELPFDSIYEEDLGHYDLEDAEMPAADTAGIGLPTKLKQSTPAPAVGKAAIVGAGMGKSAEVAAGIMRPFVVGSGQLVTAGLGAGPRPVAGSGAGKPTTAALAGKSFAAGVGKPPAAAEAAKTAAVGWSGNATVTTAGKPAAHSGAAEMDTSEGELEADKAKILRQMSLA